MAENTDKQKSVFTELQNSAKKRVTKKKRGLSKPPSRKQAGNNTKLKEHTPAVPVHTSKARSYRLSTNIHQESGDKLEDLIIAIRKKEGKKPSIGEVIERALDLLESKH